MPQKTQGSIALAARTPHRFYRGGKKRTPARRGRYLYRGLSARRPTLPNLTERRRKAIGIQSQFWRFFPIRAASRRRRPRRGERIFDCFGPNPLTSETFLKPTALGASDERPATSKR